MSGLFVSIPFPNHTVADETFQKGLAVTTRASGRDRVVTSSPHLHLGAHHVSSLGPSHASSGQVEVHVDGLLFPRGNLEPAREDRSAAHALKLYETYGEDLQNHVNGEFNLVVRDHARRRTLVANDRFGLRPWYTYETSDAIWFSPSPKSLIEISGHGPKLDPVVLAGFLSFNKMRLGDRTIFEGISVLPPSSRWIFTDGDPRVRKDTTWTLHYSDDPGDTSAVESGTVETLVDLYRTAMSQRAATSPGRRVAVCLSGGLDSRSMIGALSPDERKHIATLTYGLPESDEVQLAERVAALAGTHHRVEPMYAPTFVEHAHRGPILNGELDIFVQAGQHDCLQRMPETADVIMTGLDLDVTLGGIYMVPDVLAAKSDRDILDLLRARNRIFPMNEIPALFGSALKPHMESPFEQALDLIAELPQESFPVKYDHFIHRYSMRRLIFTRYAQLRHYTETATPMADYDFLDEVFRLPYLRRAGHGVFHPFINRLCPELCTIPYQRTTLPANVPPEFWAEAVRIEADREALYTQIFRKTHGRVEVPYRRYYSNFGEWLRADPAWIKLSDDLLGPGARIYEQDLIRYEFVSHCLEQHRKAECDRRQQLICLMSLELFLRATF